MSSRKSQTGTHVDLYKRVQEEQRSELRQLHHDYRTRDNILVVEYRTAYEKLTTQKERAVLLTTFVQKKSEYRQAHKLDYERLLAHQSIHLENLLGDLIGSAELHKRKQIKSARTVIETAIKLGTLSMASLH